MTKTLPAATAPAPRREARTRASAVATLLGLIGLLAALAPWQPATAATAATPDPEDVVAAGTSFRLAATGDGIVDEDGRLGVLLSVVNQSGTTLDRVAAEIEVSRRPLGSRTSVSAWLDGTSAPALRTAGSATLATVPSLSATTTTVDLEVGDDLDPGVYAVEARYPAASNGTEAAEPLRARGVWVVPDEDAGGTVAVVVPLTAGARTDGLLTSDELAELTAPGGALRAQLDAVTGTAAILAVDPAVVAAIRALGTTAPDTAVTWLQDLLDLPNTRFALQFADADLAVQVRAGLDEPLTVPTFDPFIVAAGVDTTTPTPAATPDADAPALPDAADLTDIGGGREGMLWPADGSTDADVLAALGALPGGPSGGDPLILVPSTAVRGEDGPRAQVGDAQLLVHDAEVSAALQTAGSAPLRVDRTAALAEARAYATFTDSGTPLLVTVGRDADRTTVALRIAVRAALRLDDRTAVGLPAIAATLPVRQVAASGTAASIDEAGGERVAALQGFLEDEDRLADFATVLEDPTVLTAAERAAVLQLLGNAWLADRSGWEEAVEAHTAETEATLDAIGIVPSPDIRLLGSSAPLTFSIRNDLPWPASLVLVASPNDLRLRVQNTTEVTAGALQTTRVDVPVEARVGSGESELTLRLRSPAMVPVGTPTTVAVTVEAEWESVGIVVMAVLVSGLIALGIIRTVLRFRRRRVPASDGRSDG